jgi:hypothetical protein
MSRYRWFSCLAVLCMTVFPLGAQAKMPIAGQAQSSTICQVSDRFGAMAALGGPKPADVARNANRSSAIPTFIHLLTIVLLPSVAKGGLTAWTQHQEWNWQDSLTLSRQF